MAFNLSTETKILKKNLDHLKSLPVDEYTFLKKYEELRNAIEPRRSLIHDCKLAIWDCQPSFIDEARTIEIINNLKPKVLICDTKLLTDVWKTFRRFGHSGEDNQPPSRFIRFLVVDPSWTNPFYKGRDRCFDFPEVLGFGAISGDFPALSDRDNFIGWTREQRHGEGMLRHTAIGSTIAATQPFGFNFLGSKLIAALITLLRYEWQLQTGDVLVGLTTTSLYASIKPQSIYDNCPHWHKLGNTTGRVPLIAASDIRKRWVDYLKEKHRAEYNDVRKQKEDVSGPVTNEKIKIWTLILKKAGLRLSEYEHGFQRGIYFSEFYENTKDFLCGRITEADLKLKPLFEKGSAAILEWWRPLAIGRFKYLKKKHRLKNKRELYNRLDQMDYEMAKEIYLSEIGR